MSDKNAFARPSEVSLEVIQGELDGVVDGLRFHTVMNRFLEALKVIGDGEHPDKVRLRSEMIAFDFSEGGGLERDKATYYGPAFVYSTADGAEHESPPLSAVTSEMLRYWADRAAMARNPALRARYADLCWDLSMATVGERPDISQAHLAIDCSIQAVQKGIFKDGIVSILRLKRALDLALSVRDAPRAELATQAILDLEDKIARDHLPGLWGFAFDALVGTAKVSLKAEQREKVISDLEARFDRITTLPRPDPTCSEAAAFRLAAYYRKRGNRYDEQRILRRYAQAIQVFASQVSPPMASSWLDRVHETLAQHGLTHEADVVALQMRDVEPRTLAEFKKYETTIDIPRAELAAMVDEILQGDLKQVLPRFAVEFLVDPEDVEVQVRETAKQAPLLSRIEVSVRDSEGRKTAQVGSIDDDIDGRIVSEIGRRFEISAGLLRHVCALLVEKHSLGSDKIIDDVLGTDSIFLVDRNPLLKRGLDAYFANDHYVSLCVLIPEIEAGLRRLLHISGGSVYKRSRTGATNLRTLDEILRDSNVISALTSRMCRHLQALLTDARAWNLRNVVCHGLVVPDAVGPVLADRIFHVVVLLSCIRLIADTGAKDPAHVDSA